MKDSRGTIAFDQTPISEWLRTIPPLPRLLLGSIPCAAVALYLPIFFLVLFGGWINVLTLWLTNSIAIAVLALVNLIGNKFGRLYLVAFVLTLALTAYAVDLTAREWTWGQWRDWWQNFFFIGTAIPLNAYLFTCYKKVAGLDLLPRPSRR